MRNIRNYNSKGQFHGYQERYRDSSKSMFKYFYNNGIRINYEELYRFNCELKYKCLFNNGIRVGYGEYHDYDGNSVNVFHI